MSGSFAMPHALTGGAGYKAHSSYDEFLRKHSGFYRRHSAASNAQEADRRASQISDSMAADAAQAVANTQRRDSVQHASVGSAASNNRRGSVVVASDNEREDNIFGMESSAGVVTDPNRRPSTSLASDLYHKLKGK